MPVTTRRTQSEDELPRAATDKANDAQGREVARKNIGRGKRGALTRVSDLMAKALLACYGLRTE